MVTRERIKKNKRRFLLSIILIGALFPVFGCGDWVSYEVINPDSNLLKVKFLNKERKFQVILKNHSFYKNGIKLILKNNNGHIEGIKTLFLARCKNKIRRMISDSSYILYNDSSGYLLIASKSNEKLRSRLFENPKRLGLSFSQDTIIRPKSVPLRATIIFRPEGEQPSNYSWYNLEYDKNIGKTIVNEYSSSGRLVYSYILSIVIDEKLGKYSFFNARYFVMNYASLCFENKRIDFKYTKTLKN